MDDVFVFGAGATKDCGGPLTDEILHDAFKAGVPAVPEGLVPLDHFLRDVYRMDPDPGRREKIDYPALPQLITLIDTALARHQNVTPEWTWERVAAVRSAVEYAILLSLHARVERVENNHYFNLFMSMAPSDAGPTAISLNYDTIVDRAIYELSNWNGTGGLPHYGCGLHLPRRASRPFGRLLKLHGSVDWFRCKPCGRLAQMKSGWSIYQMEVPSLPAREANSLARNTLICSTCGKLGESFIVAPSQRKTYDDAHLNDIWKAAESVLREAQRVHIIGYSLPEDDVEILLLLIHSLAHLDPSCITVVQYDEKKRKLREHPTGRRYAALFGEVRWFTDGFAAWVEQGGPRWAR